MHNGSLSNHNRPAARAAHARASASQTDNDTEVAAGYLTWRLREGASLQEALEGCLDDLDGFYTFAVGTRDGFAVLRDPIACKPAVHGRDRRLGRDGLRVPRDRRAARRRRARASWEPEPAHVYAGSGSA